MRPMISTYNYKNLTWVDLESPHEDELVHIMERYAIPATIAEQVISDSPHSKIEQHTHFTYLILHFPSKEKDGDNITTEEVDFIIGADFIITTHYGPMDSLRSFSKTFEKNMVHEKHIEHTHAGFLFGHLLRALYYTTREDLDKTHVFVKEAEKRVFDGTEEAMVAVISLASRQLLEFRQALRFHDDVLTTLEQSLVRMFGEGFRPQIKEIIDDYVRVQDRVDGYKEIIDDIRITNDSLLANKTNKTMKILTIITFLISPITIVSSVFMMNTDFVMIKTPLELAIIIGIMILLSLVTFIYFKHKKWL